MNVLSVFDGISCGMIALERAGIKVDSYFASEIDSNASAISEKNYPNIIRLGDVTKWKEWMLPRIDLFIGGSPCQGFSRNGIGLNFEDPRSRLFFEYVSILKDFKAKNPDLKFLLENVEMKKEWEQIITDFLAVEPRKINSKLLSAQSRPRIYWTNIDFNDPEDAGITLKSILEDNHECEDLNDDEKNLLIDVDGRLAVKQATKQGFIFAEDGDGINLQFPTSKTRRGRVIKQKSPTLDCQCNVCVCVDGNVRKLSINEIESLQTLPKDYTAGFPDRIRKKAIGNGWTVDVIAHIFKGLEE